MNTVADKDQVCEALCDLLENGEDVHRTVVAQTLGRMGYVEAVPDLIQGLLDEDEDVRTDVAAALAELADSRSAEPLMQNLLGDPCWEVKLAAIDALTKMGHSDLVPWLRRMLKGKDEEIVWDESEFYETGWDDWVDIQVKVIKALARFGDQEAVPEIVEALDDEYGQDLSEVAFTAFAGLGDAGAAALASYATSDNARLRRAVTVLGTVDNIVASETMTRALVDEDADVREAAGRAVATRDPADPRLEMLLLDRKPEIRAAFVALCGRYYPGRLSDMLSEDNNVLLAAVLQEIIKDPALIEEMGLKGRLLEILDTAGPETAALATSALMQVSPEDMETPLLEKLADPETALEIRLAVIKAVASRPGEAVLQVLEGVLGDDQRQVRLAAMTALADYSKVAEDFSDEAGGVLLAALRGEIVLPPEDSDETPETFEETSDEIAADAGDADPATDVSVEDAGEEVTVSETIEMAQSVQPVRSVAEIEAEETVAAASLPEEVEIEVRPGSTLAALLDDEPGTVDEEPVESTPVELTEEDLDYMELTNQKPRRKVMSPETTLAPHQDVRRYAARVLGDFPQEDVTMALAGVLTDEDRDLVITALDSLARAGAETTALPNEVVDALLAISETQDNDVRIAVSKALAHVNTGEAIARMQAYLTDSSSFVRAEAVHGLALAGQVDAGVEACLGDEAPSVRMAAARALAQEASDATVQRLGDFSMEFEAFHILDVAALLADRHAETARTLYLQILDDGGRKRYWKSAIEALEKIGRPGDRAALAARQRLTRRSPCP